MLFAVDPAVLHGRFPPADLREVHIVSSRVRHRGYLVVVGLVLDILRTLGAEVDRQGEASGQVPPEISHDSPRVTHDDVKPPILGVDVGEDQGVRS